MADILIRGISLPEGELKYVSLWVYGDGRVYVSNNASAASSQRLQDLAVPLPEGHGRIGDLDALMEIIRAHDYPLTAHFNSTDNGMFTQGIQQAVDEVPTIVPAEGDVNDGA